MASRVPNQTAPLETGSDDWDNEYRSIIANRMIQMYSHIVQCLDDEETAEFYGILSKVVELSKCSDSHTQENLDNLYQNFLDMSEFRAGISVPLIKQVMRSFLMIEDDPHELGHLVMNRVGNLINMEYPSIATDLKFLDELMEVYYRVLTEGVEEVDHLNVAILGVYGAGKTSLTRQLCGQSGGRVTNTGDITVSTCRVRHNGDWELDITGGNEHFLSLRMKDLLIRYRGSDTHSHCDIGENQKSEKASANANHVENNTSNIQGSSSYQEFRKALTMKDLTDKHEDKIIDHLKTCTNISAVTGALERQSTISMWDFSGQSVFYSTHHFFINSRSVYILVMDLSKNLYDINNTDSRTRSRSNLTMEDFTKGYTCLDVFKFWVRSIYSYLNQNIEYDTMQGEVNEWMPKIILVGTHADRVTKHQLNRRSLDQYKEDYFSEAMLPFIGTPALELFHDRKFLINTVKPTGNTIRSIREEINKLAKYHPSGNKRIPANYIPLEREVVNLKMTGQSLIKLSDLQQINTDLEYPLTDPEIASFLDHQHELGNIIHYNIEGLTELVILNPQWLVDVYKVFVIHMADKKPTLLKSWKDYKESGQLRPDLMDAILNKHELIDYRHEIIIFMEMMDIFVRPLSRHSSTLTSAACSSQGYKNGETVYFFVDGNAKAKTTLEDFCLVPSMLPPTPDIYALKILFKITEQAVNTPTLCFCICDGILPPKAFHQIIATALREIPNIALYSGRKLLFNSLGSFKVTNTTQLTIWAQDNVIHLRVTFKSETESHADRLTYCQGLKERFSELILMTLKLFHDQNNTHNTESDKGEQDMLDLRVKCPKCPEQVPFEHKYESGTDRPVDYGLSLLKVKDILDPNREVECGWCNNIVNAEQALNFWFNH